MENYTLILGVHYLAISYLYSARRCSATLAIAICCIKLNIRQFKYLPIFADMNKIIDLITQIRCYSLSAANLSVSIDHQYTDSVHLQKINLQQLHNIQWLSGGHKIYRKYVKR